MSDYEKGKQLLQAKDYTGALAAFLQSISNNESTIEAHIYAGNCYNQLQQPNKAKEMYENVLKINPNYYKAFSYLGNIYFYAKDYDNAYLYFEKFSQRNLSPKDSISVYTAMYKCRYAQRLFARAYDNIHYATFFNEQDKSLRLIELTALNAIDKYENVLLLLDKLDTDGNEKMTQDKLLQKAIALCGLNRLDECLDICFEYQSNNPLFNYPAAIALLKKEENKLALDLADNYIKADKEAAEGYFIKAKAYQKLGETSETVKLLTYTIDNFPYYCEPQIELANIYIKQLNYNEALKSLKMKVPNNADHIIKSMLLLLKRAEVLYCLCRQVEANEIMEQVGEYLRDDKIEEKMSPIVLTEAFDQYFTLFYLKEGYSIKDFDKGTEEIGKGGFGIVTKGKLKDKVVAVKEYKIQQDKGMKKFFINCIDEMKNMEVLRNGPHIVKFVTMFYTDNKLYILIDFCYGGNLNELLRNTSVSIPIRRRIEILAQVAEAIAYLHSFKPHFIHHDIKSHNVLLNKPFNPNGYNEVLLCDFGITKRTYSFSPSGTPAWIAPERLRCVEYDEKADVYSFAVLCWETFTRKVPFEGYDKDQVYNSVIIRLRPDIDLLEGDTPKAIKDLIEECWKHEPKERPSMEEVLKRLKTMI